MKVGKLVIRAETFKENKVFVSLSPELGVSSFGKTASEAKKSLKEAVLLFLEECQRMGTLREVLKESGFKVKGQSWLPPKPLVERLVVGM